MLSLGTADYCHILLSDHLMPIYVATKCPIRRRTIYTMDLLYCLCDVDSADITFAKTKHSNSRLYLAHRWTRLFGVKQPGPIEGAAGYAVVEEKALVGVIGRKIH